MHQRFHVMTLLLVLLLGALLSGCGSEATATPVPPEPTEAPTANPTEAPTEAPEAEDDFTLLVNEASFTMTDLKAMKQVTVETVQPDKEEAEEYTGVRILDVLDAANAQGATLTLVADDGYTFDVPMADLTADCLLSYRTKGGLRAVMPDMGGGAWVKGVVELRVSGETDAGGGDAVMVTVNGTSFTMADLQAMEQVTADAPPPNTGVRILDLLDAADAQGGTLTMLADDGYSVDIPVASLDENCLLAFTDEGKLNAVMPGFDGSAQVRAVIEMTMSGEPAAAAEEAAVVVNGTPFSMADLQAMEQVTVEATQPGKDEAQSYTGVRLLDLLDSDCASDGTVTLTADDGFAADVPMADLTDACLLAYRDQGGLRAVMPDLDGKAWVKGVVEVTCSGTGGEAAVVVTDALDREVALLALPERIVVPGKGAWMVGHPLYLFPEATERVLAMEARRGTVSNFIASIVPGFSDQPHLEEDAGPEQIAPLKPDLIVLKSYMAKRLGEPLEKLGFPVLYVELETPEQFYRDIANLGQVFGNPERAQEIIDFYQSRVDRVQQELEGLDEADKPSVLVIQYDAMSEEKAFTVPPTTWMQTIETQLAGGIPVWAEAASEGGWQRVNLEQVAAWDPDKILLIAFRTDPEPVLEQIKSDPKWEVIRAIQEDELYAYPADFYGWDVPDPRWVMGLTWAATKLHPDRFADVDIMQEVYDFYGEMYGMDQAAVDAYIVPQLSGDIE